MEPAWSCFEESFGWCDAHHRHSGIARLTAAEVNFGRAEQILARRQQILDQACARNSERFVNGRPLVSALPKGSGSTGPCRSRVRVPEPH